MYAEKTLNLSVVVPTYNQADLLRESLRALVDQTLSEDPYEIVVVDDGSTDQTAAVLQEFGPPVKVVRFPANRGRSAARNAGIREARAPLIVLVDRDILVRPDFLDRHLRAHRRDGAGILARGPVIDVPDVARARSAVFFYRKRPWLEPCSLIEAPRLHRVLYWLQTSGGLLRPQNIEDIVARLRRTGHTTLAFLALRGVLNRYYVQRLNDELAHDQQHA